MDIYRESELGARDDGEEDAREESHRNERLWIKHTDWYVSYMYMNMHMYIYIPIHTHIYIHIYMWGRHRREGSRKWASAKEKKIEYICIYRYTYMDTYIYTYIHVCRERDTGSPRGLTRAQGWVAWQVCIYRSTDICMQTCIYLHVDLYLYLSKYIYICIYIYMIRSMAGMFDEI